MVKVFHAETGSGNPLILLHGFCENHKIWEQFARKLSSSFRLFVPDLPGFGKSQHLVRPFSIEDVAVVMLDWIKQLNIDRSVVVGHSLGGYVAMAMVEAHPERFAGFGLFHSTAYADTEEKRENRNRVIDFVKRNGAAPFVETFVPGLFHQKNHPIIGEVHRIAMQTPAETIINYSEAMRDRPPRTSLLQNYRRPILMIAGEHDSVIPYEQSAAQSELMQFPFFSGLPASGHMGMFENEPESIKIVKDFAKLTVDFLAT